MANIRDVAKAAGVSIATSSRILSNDSTFKAAEITKQNVFRAANQLGYAYHKREKFSPKISIGCILPITSEKYSDPFFTSILHSIEEECNKHNIIISAIRNCTELQDSQILREILCLKLQGLIIMEALPDSILSVLNNNIPNIIMIDQPDFKFHSIGFDHNQANMQVMEYFMKCGYRKIAYIGGAAPFISVIDSLRLICYREALRKNNIPYDESLILDCGWDLNLCAEHTRMLLTSSNRPDAIYAGSDTLASVILGVIYKLGLKCPDDVGVIGFNNLDISAHTIPPLTTIDIPTKDIGKLAAKKLLELLQNSDIPITRIVVPTSLVIRDSTRSIREA